VDTEWALEELDIFLKLTAFRPSSDRSPTLIRSNVGSMADIVASAQVVEQIFDRLLPTWRTDVPDHLNKRINRWCQHIETAQRVRTVLQRQAEVQEKLGDNAPRLNAAHLHPWVWEGARSLWQSSHYREAVRAACVKLNAETQNKLGRRDVSEAALFIQAFSTDPPQPDRPRLRVMPEDDSKTFTSIHRGIWNFAEGCFAAIRNPLSHTEGDLSEDQALEQLAALSVLARWVDSATIVTQRAR